MKKKLAMMLIAFELFSVLLVTSVSARDIWEIPESTPMRAMLVFISTRDLYRMSYSGYPASADSSRLNFWASDGRYFSLDSNNPPSGSYYLTCNGRYILEVFSGGVNGTKVAETPIKVTTKIQSPTCQSYTNPGERLNELGLSDNNGQPNGDGKIPLTWNAAPGASYYEVYKDGEKVGETTDTRWDIDSPGSYTVVARNPSGEVVGESDYDAPDPFPTNDGGGGSGCDACKWLTDTLACPAWDEYLGDLTGAIRDALPPPPNWDEVADTFVGKFADYFGDVPPPPSREEIRQNITPTLPPLDTSVPGSNLTPTVPEEFNDGPIEFDITDGPQIPVVDESKPFEIYEPDQFVDSDEPGVSVLPGDDRNSTGGIKQPDTTEDNAPPAQPQPTIHEDPLPMPGGNGEVPPDDMPKPGASEEPPPIPSGAEDTVPIPRREAPE